MLFNSYLFWLFFAAVVLLNCVLRHTWQNRMLLVASYVFYGTWDWRFLSLIWLSTCVDYVVAFRVAPKSSTPENRRKYWLALSLATNLGLLGFFKYYGFFIHEMGDLLAWLGVSVNVPTLHVILPVGISFYTFQTMSYTIDVFRGKTRPVDNFLDFALYVAFFPQLVAGPIERSTRLMPQVLLPRRRAPGDFSQGLYLVIIGLFKKIVIADNMAIIVNGVFQTPPSQLSGFECLLGVYAFAFQIYGDFSGYSSIARGTAKWLGFDLMVNFNLPYLAQSPREFWHRWHISLSTWLRDYLYIPLGGSRHGTFATYRNLMLTMALGGLWHGAGWTFICWGILHGLLLCGDRALLRQDAPPPATFVSTMAALLRIITTFHLVCLGWLLFRAESMGQALSMLGLMLTDFRITPFVQFAAATLAFYLVPFMTFEYWLARSGDLDRPVKVAWPVRAGIFSYCAVMMLLFHPIVAHEFIYFQF